jgi:methyltransferase (TIGR00027 family)
MTITHEPDPTAVRVALWRALHVELDGSPHVLDDTVGLSLAEPADGWRERGDMHPIGTSGFRAWIVARARFVEDLIVEEFGRGLAQYVMLGAGLDTFAQRRPDIASRLTVFEVDQPEASAWKRERLVETGYGIPDWLRLVPVDFERTDGWAELSQAGFDRTKTALVVSAGVSMYLTKEANAETLRQIAALAPGSVFAMTFQLPEEFVDEQDREGRGFAIRGAAASGTPFISFYSPAEMLAAAREAGFRDVRHVPSRELAERYFSGREDGLRPSSGEDLLVATV